MRPLLDVCVLVLEAAEADITFEDGLFTVGGTDKSVELVDVARFSFQPANLPDNVEPGLYEVGSYDGGLPTFPNGCHVSEIEIDQATGQIEIVKYTVVDDVGTVLNPLLLKGQIHGGIAQGVGQVLMEDISVDPESGQVITGSFMDYAMPRADDFPFFDVHEHNIPSKNNPLGLKGAGEAGTVGALPSVMNAVCDALRPLGIRHISAGLDRRLLGALAGLPLVLSPCEGSLRAVAEVVNGLGVVGHLLLQLHDARLELLLQGVR